MWYSCCVYVHETTSVSCPVQYVNTRKFNKGNKVSTNSLDLIIISSIFHRTVFINANHPLFFADLFISQAIFFVVFRSFPSHSHFLYWWTAQLILKRIGGVIFLKKVSDTALQWTQAYLTSLVLDSRNSVTVRWFALWILFPPGPPPLPLANIGKDLPAAHRD